MRRIFLSRYIVLAVCLLIAVASLLFISATCAFASQPNIILINTDDMGWGDFCGNNDPANPINVKLCGPTGPGTPRLMELAESGVTLTNFYTPTPICSPSRAALMTGQDPRRHKIYAALPLTDNELLKKEATTVADVLLTAGYNTAIIGKWHLGWDNTVNCPKGCNSWDNGFEYNYVLPLGIGQFHKGFCLAEKYPYQNEDEAKWHYKYGILGTNYPASVLDEQYNIVSIGQLLGRIDSCNPNEILTDETTTNPKPANNELFSIFSAGTSLTRKFTNKAIEYISNTLDLDPGTPNIKELARDLSKPFFLYLAYPAPHAPLYIHLDQATKISIPLNDLNVSTNMSYTQCPAVYCSTNNDSTCGCLPKDVNSICETTTDRQKCEIALLYPNVINEIDNNVGQVLDELNKTQDPRNPGQVLANNTIVIFTSDNGPFGGENSQYADYGRTGGLRGSKKFTYEGGVRVPFIARWPKNWPSDDKDVNTANILVGAQMNNLADMMDIFPTLLSAATITVTNGGYAGSKTTVTDADNKKYDVDGKNIKTLLQGVLPVKVSSSQDKNVQITWFHNKNICLLPGDVDCPKNNYSDPSHPFAIRSNAVPGNVATPKETLASGQTVTTTVQDYKLYVTSNYVDSGGIKYDGLLDKPVELYFIRTGGNESEKESSNLCKEGNTDQCIICTPEYNDVDISQTKLNCSKTAPSWKYKTVVEMLWKRAAQYQQRTRSGLFYAP